MESATLTERPAPLPGGGTPGEPRQAESRPARADGRIALWALAGITIAGAALRFSTLGDQSFWFDEVFTSDVVLRPSLADTFATVGETESNPPLYYVLAWFWAQLFGQGEVGLRSFSALAGTATIPVVYACARTLASRPAGLIAAALVAFNPLLFYYSQEARPYALLVLLAAVSFLFFVRTLRGGGRRDLWFWAAASAAAICTHYFAAFLIAAETAYLLTNAEDRRRVAIAAGAIALVGLELLPLALVQEGRTYNDWIAETPLGSRVESSVKHVLLGPDPATESSPGGKLDLGIWLTVGIALAFVAALTLVARRARPSRAAIRAAGAVAAGSIAVALLIALLGPDYFSTRNMLGVMVPLICGAAVAIATLKRRGRIALTAILAAASLAATTALETDPHRKKSDLRAAASVLDRWNPELVISARLADRPLMHYLGVRKAGPIVRARTIVWLVEYGEPLVQGMPRAFVPTRSWRRDGMRLYAYRAPRQMRLKTGAFLDNGVEDGDVLTVLLDEPAQVRALASEATTPRTGSGSSGARTRPR